MANEIKYQNQVWAEPIAGERLSTNGHYTGEQVGSPLQDAKDSVNDAYAVENNTIRYGHMTQDAVEGSTPKVVGEA